MGEEKSKRHFFRLLKRGKKKARIDRISRCFGKGKKKKLEHQLILLLLEEQKKGGRKGVSRRNISGGKPSFICSRKKGSSVRLSPSESLKGGGGEGGQRLLTT